MCETRTRQLCDVTQVQGRRLRTRHPEGLSRATALGRQRALRLRQVQPQGGLHVLLQGGPLQRIQLAVDDIVGCRPGSYGGFQRCANRSMTLRETRAHHPIDCDKGGAN